MAVPTLLAHLKLLVSSADGRVRFCLAAAVALGVAASLCAAAAPLALKHLVDSAAADWSAASAGFAFAYAGLLTASKAVGQLQAYAFARAELRLQRGLSTATFAHFIRLPLLFHLGESPGTLIQVQAQALLAMRSVLGQVFLVVLPAAVQVSGILLIVAGTMEAMFWTILAFGMAGYAAAFGWSARQGLALGRAAVARQVSTSRLASDSLSNIETVKALTAENDIQARHARLSAETEALWLAVRVNRLRTGLGVAMVFGACFGAMMWLTLTSLAAGTASVGDLVLVNAYMLQIVQPLEVLGFAGRDLYQSSAYVERWSRTMQTPPEPHERADEEGGCADEDLTQAPEVAFHEVTCQYPRGMRALSDVTFTAPAGAVVAIVGASGAGKSSLLRLILGHVAPASGRVTIDGAPVGQIPRSALRRATAVVSQDVTLFHATLRDNLLIARPDATPAALSHALERAGLTGLLSRLPDGLETVVGERGAKLSGGERQRVAIARALLRDARLMLLDEATSSLDADTESAVADALLAAANGRTTLVVTHRLALAARAQMIVVLDAGRVTEQGAHADLLAAGGAYARMWRLQQAVAEAGGGHG